MFLWLPHLGRQRVVDLDNMKRRLLYRAWTTICVGDLLSSIALTFWYLRVFIGTVFIRLTAQGAYLIFGPESGRLFEPGRLLTFSAFRMGAYSW